MTTEHLRPPTSSAGPEPFSDEFDSSSRNGQGAVNVIHGLHTHPLPLVGMAVRRARSELAELMHVPPDGTAVVDGREVDEDTILQEGQTLSFVSRAGEKG